MGKDLSPLTARVVAGLRALAQELTEAGNPADAIRLQGYAATVSELKCELIAAESRRASKPTRNRRCKQRQLSET